MKLLSRIKFNIYLSTLSLPLVWPGISFAQSDPPANSSVVLNNPLKVDNIQDFLQAILEIVIIIATPIVIFFIIYAGFLYVTAQGSAEQTQKATRALTYAIIGGVLIIGAVAIGEIIKNLVNAF